MNMLNVQFTDSTSQVIASYFGSPQDPAVFPNQGVISSTDPRWATFRNSFPAVMLATLPASS